MGAVSLATLRARARERADMVGSSFVADTATSLDAWLNEGAQILHDKLVEAYGSEYLEKSTTATTTTATDYALPSDFYKLLGVDLLVQGATVTLQPYMRPERNFRSSQLLAYNYLPRYLLTGSNLRLTPAPQSGQTLTIWYVPPLQVLQNGSGSTYINLLTNTNDTINFPNGWERYVVLYAAIQAMLKEESDVRALQGELAKMDMQLDEIIENRNVSEPMQATDIYAKNNYLPWDYLP